METNSGNVDSEIAMPASDQAAEVGKEALAAEAGTKALAAEARMLQEEREQLETEINTVNVRVDESQSHESSIRFEMVSASPGVQGSYEQETRVEIARFETDSRLSFDSMCCGVRQPDRSSLLGDRVNNHTDRTRGCDPCAPAARSSTPREVPPNLFPPAWHSFPSSGIKRQMEQISDIVERVRLGSVQGCGLSMQVQTLTCSWSPAYPSHHPCN